MDKGSGQHKKKKMAILLCSNEETLFLKNNIVSRIKANHSSKILV